MDTKGSSTVQGKQRSSLNMVNGATRHRREAQLETKRVLGWLTMWKTRKGNSRLLHSRDVIRPRPSQFSDTTVFRCPDELTCCDYRLIAAAALTALLFCRDILNGNRFDTVCARHTARDPFSRPLDLI